jgi:hypothetical protein
MTTNGTHPPPSAIPRDPTDPPDQQYLPDSWAPLLADLRWLDEQYNLGAFEAHRGEHVAAVSLAVVGHGRDLTELYERVARELGVPPGRVATVYVDELLFTE